MKTTWFAVATSTMTMVFGTVHAESLDAMQFEQRMTAAARDEASSLERSFARMLARADEAPIAAAPRGEPDEVDRLVAQALAPYAKCAMRPVPRPQPDRQ